MVEQPHQPQCMSAPQQDCLLPPILDGISHFNAPRESYSFVPTDEVLVTCYLKPYLKGNKDSTIIVPINLVDIYKSNPENLSETEGFKTGNEKEWFFISERTDIGKAGEYKKCGENGGYWRVVASPKKINAGQVVVG
ncbi:PREDICTED: NAC domain-containing protein 90-like [Camelina sativa]|uniref:NAC domain-containing protein 90-like n=1 Tax=Camelina sativa TaxID=90675 RepID=A0ABM1RKR2_CAMSA|nr:PREDICTED: NAC domain-containing protein 90-like [Camelina sativa]